MDLDLDYILTLDTVEREGSFSAAAAALNKVQSAVSYDIRQLEEHLGVKIFDRSGHRSKLTPVGRLVLEEGRLLLGRARRLEAIATQHHTGWEPHLEVVVDGILPMDPVLAVLSTMAEEGVPTRIQIKVEFLGGVQARFEQDRAHMMLVKEYLDTPFLTARPLPEVRCVLVAAAKHSLSEGESWSLPDLQQHVELTVHDSSQSGASVDRHMFGGARVMYLSDFYTKRQALLRGLGFGWMPRYLVRDDLDCGALKEVKFDGGSRFRFTPHLVHLQDRPLGKAGRMFLELLEQGIEKVECPPNQG